MRRCPPIPGGGNERGKKNYCHGRSMLHDACNACASAAECTAADRLLLPRRTSILTAAAANRQRRLLRRRRRRRPSLLYTGSGDGPGLHHSRPSNRRCKRKTVSPPFPAQHLPRWPPSYGPGRACAIAVRRVPPFGGDTQGVCVCVVCNDLGRGFFLSF